MPFSYRIDSDAGMLFIAGKGVMTQTERIEALCDFSNAVSTPSLVDLKEIADRPLSVRVFQEHQAALAWLQEQER